MTDRPLPGLVAGVALLFLVVASLWLKLWLALLAAGLPCIADECTYIRMADQLVSGSELLIEGHLWSPGFPRLLAWSFERFGAWLVPARLLLVLLSTATVPLVYAVGAALYGRGAGLVAAGLFAFFPDLLAYSHYLRPETPFLLAVTACFALLLRPRPGVGDAAFAGLALGLASLLKGVGFYFGPLAAAWLLFGRSENGSGPGESPRGRPRRRGLLAVVFTLFMLVPIAPWTLRNWRAFERFVPVEATLGRNLYIGNNLPAPVNWDLGMGERRTPVEARGGRPRCSDAHPIDADRCETRRALAFAAGHPGLTLRRVPLKLADLLSPTSHAIRVLHREDDPYRLSPGAIRGATLLLSLSWLAVAALGWLGFATLSPRRGQGLLALYFAYHLGIVVLTFGLSRFRVPLEPFVIACAAPLLTPAGWRELRRAPRVRRALAAAGLLALAALWWARRHTVLDLL